MNELSLLPESVFQEFRRLQDEFCLLLETQSPAFLESLGDSHYDLAGFLDDLDDLHREFITLG